jgi:NhaA family Na+:H+ antiporter
MPARLLSRPAKQTGMDPMMSDMLKIRGRGRRPIEQILSPFQKFAHTQTASGILLLVCSAVAIILANSPAAAWWNSVWEAKVTIGYDGYELSKPLLLWVNDGLMALFFFVVGLEIKREALVGELSSPRQAALPIAAAIGGMAAPALFYAFFNAGQAGAAGWGVPMATDIAFALGVLALLGSRVPPGLKIFLAALAIVDDLGAILVIAIFYTAELSVSALAVAAGVLVMLIAANILGVRSPLVYALFGAVLWVAFLKSGVHATIAGVLLALTIPARTLLDDEEFVAHGQELLGLYAAASGNNQEHVREERQVAVIQALETACEHATAPLQRLERELHAWVAFFIMPVFALANAGIELSGNLAAAIASPVTHGVMAGLVLGKPLGILLVSWIVVRLGWAVLPGGVTWAGIHAVGWLGGIGFTMALFIGGLAFAGAPQLLQVAKLGVLSASALAGVVGLVLLHRALAPAPKPA